MYYYKYELDGIGGVILYECIGGIPIRDRYLQPGDDANTFLTEINNANNKQTIIDAYFAG